ncbi:hypothetical protein BJ546DRAFT_970524 [Cryomyces antarcticus]|nr:hypothetical protein LTR04_007297 [Oleoguttula sp. CCFEE 6159]
MLEAWENDGEERAAPPPQLILSEPFVDASNSPGYSPETKVESSKQQQQLNYGNAVFNHRYDHSVIRFTSHAELPKLRRVARFQANVDIRPAVDMSAVARIAAAFSNLRNTRWNLDDNEGRHVDRRRRYRKDLANALASHDFPQLKDAWISMLYEAPLNQHATPRDLLDSSVDTLSASFRTFSQSQSLVSLTICGVVGPDIFWPAQVNAGSPPTWPSLEIFAVTFNIAAPSGDWYFQRDAENSGNAVPADEDARAESDGEEDDASSSGYSDNSFFESRSDAADSYDSEREARLRSDRPINPFRTIPNPRTMQPFLEAMAKAAAHMPRLRRISLLNSDVLAAGALADWEVAYFAPGEDSYIPGDVEECDAQRRRVYWTVGTWRPAGDTVSLLWEKVGVASGTDMVQRFVNN